jgi:hypothetical protein
LVGLAVGSAIAGTQNSMFESASAQHFTAVRKNTPADLVKLFEGELLAEMKANSFASSRLRSTSDNQVITKVDSHRLVRVSKNDDGDLLLTPEIFAVIELRDGSGKKLAGGHYRRFGNEMHTIKDYATKPALVKAAYKETFRLLSQDFSAALSSKAR